MALRHPENFVVYQNDLASRALAAPLLADVDRAITGARTVADISNLTARRTTLEWQVLLDQGDELFRQRKFDQALSTYQQLSRKILELIQPRFGQFGVPTRWLEGQAITQALTAASAELLNHLLPGAPKASLVSPSALEELDPIRLGAHQIGSVRHVSSLADATQVLISRASAATEAGRWSEAADLYGSIADQVTQPQLRAEALLNLGAVEIQRNRPQEAIRVLGRARAAFQQADDKLGVAEALHNTALAQLRAERGADARRSLDEAEKAAGAASLRGLLSAHDKFKPFPHKGVPTAEAEVLPESRAVEAEQGATEPALAVRSALSTTSLVTQTLDAEELAGSLGSDDLVLRLRPLQNSLAVSQLKLTTPAQERIEDFGRALQLLDGDAPVSLAWSRQNRLQSSALIPIYDARRVSALVDRLGFIGRTPEETASKLPHLYHLVLPIKMADCSRQLGEHSKAHDEYLRAARYQYINIPLEGADLWRRIAENVLEWGDKLFRTGNTQAALPVYGLLVTDQGRAPSSVLYSLASLAPTGAKAATWLDALVDQTALPELNPALAQVLHAVRARWAYINAGLDFFGQLAAVVTPFTFRYLQEIARYLAQRAIQTEQRYIEFYTRFESGLMTQRELQNATELADLGVELAQQNEVTAQATLNAADAAVDLAQIRFQNGQAQLAQFNDVAWELEQLAGHIARGSAWTGGDLPNLHYSAGGAYDFEGEKHEVMQQLARRQTQISNDLQRARLQDAVQELDAARAVADAQRDVAAARLDAARIETQIAETRSQHASEMLEAFNEQRFNPEQWLAMANLMRFLSNTALDRAIELARLMESAYNFENFDQRRLIRSTYQIASTNDHLGGEVLLSDIDGFTHYHATRTQQKPIPVKWGLSLAEEFPGAFLGFLRTGRMNFDIDLARIVLAHPGTYRHRLVGAELEIDGFLPPTGLHGRLTNSGLGRYRDRTGSVRLRLQPAETSVLSRYSRRNDALLLTPPADLRALFEGNSVASGWTIEVPRVSNDVDLNVVFDVRLVLYFDCLFDPNLFAADIQPPEGSFSRERSLFFRHHFPDAYYQLRESGNATVEMFARDFPFNQQDPRLEGLALAVVPSQGQSLSGVRLDVEHPGQVGPASVVVSDQHVIAKQSFPIAADASALGNYRIALAEDFASRKDHLDDLVLVLTYRYTPFA